MAIKDFWERYYRKVKPLGEGNGHGVFVNKNTVLYRNTTARLILNPKIRPEWVKEKEHIHVFIPKIYRNETKGEVLLHSRIRNQDIPLIVKKGNRIIFNFDPVETIKFLMKERYYRPKRRLYTYLPVHFHILPGSSRKLMKKILFMFRKEKNFPSWPVEKSVELLRHVLLKCIEAIEGRKIKLDIWPKNKKYVICLSHDVETGGGFKRIPLISKIERKYSLVSSWSIVSNHYKIDFRLLDSLIKKGDEILLHGYNHDNKLISLDDKKIEKRFNSMARLKEKLKIKGFRSPCLLRSERLYSLLEKNGYLYDSSSVDTEKDSQISERNGCCTVFPYMIDGLVEIPLTLPQDARLLFRSYNMEKMVKTWANKLEFIKKVGGVAVINTHPESHLSGNRKNLKAYHDFLKYIRNDRSAWVITMKELAEYSKQKLIKTH
ncbi:hypothetical protein CMO89_04235 [Candidatus Woesearchaeota archaeon]|nr:hypothetical protein [Candidatus Woesearchaeota archaeon]|tara:strand:- start:14576 stop:15874 length:1299 start_codon:yes stop_codon:yes gene_type:complete